MRSRIFSRLCWEPRSCSASSSGDRVGSKIPICHIDEYRNNFGASRLSYQLELRLSESCSGLVALAGACGAAGLGLRTERCGPDGRVICTLFETDTTDLPRFDRAIATEGSLAIARWTTVIDF